MNLKFSIIIPSYNSLSTIKECLDAVSDLDYENYEVIVVDDCSNDGSVEVIKKFPYRLEALDQNVGSAQSRNIGAKQGKGEVLLFLDADIVISPNALELAEKYLQENKNIDVFFASFSPKLRFKNLSSQYKHLYLCYYYLKQGEKIHTLDSSFAFITKSLFEKIGGFDNKLGKISEDVDLGVRLTKAGYTIKINREIQMEHIKRYSFWNFLKTDFIRGKKISRLFFRSLFKKHEVKKERSFYLKPFNIYVNIPLSFSIAFFLIISLFQEWFLVGGFLLLIIFIGVNFDFWSYFAKMRKMSFVLRSTFLTFIDGLAMGAGLSITLLQFLIKGKNI